MATVKMPGACSGSCTHSMLCGWFTPILTQIAVIGTPLFLCGGGGKGHVAYCTCWCYSGQNTCWRAWKRSQQPACASQQNSSRAPSLCPGFPLPWPLVAVLKVETLPTIMPHSTKTLVPLLITHPPPRPLPTSPPAPWSPCPFTCPECTVRRSLPDVKPTITTKHLWSSSKAVAAAAAAGAYYTLKPHGTGSRGMGTTCDMYAKS